MSITYDGLMEALSKDKNIVNIQHVGRRIHPLTKLAESGILKVQSTWYLTLDAQIATQLDIVEKRNAKLNYVIKTLKEQGHKPISKRNAIFGDRNAWAIYYCGGEEGTISINIRAPGMQRFPLEDLAEPRKVSIVEYLKLVVD